MAKRCTSSALFHEPLAKKHSMYNCLVVMQEQRSVYNNTGHRIDGVFRPLLSLQFRKTNIPGVLVLMLAGIAIDLALALSAGCAQIHCPVRARCQSALQIRPHSRGSFVNLIQVA
jgi:hypothetical protein